MKNITPEFDSEKIKSIVKKLVLDIKANPEAGFTINRYYSEDTKLVDLAYIYQDGGLKNTLILNINSEISKEIKKFVGPKFKEYQDKLIGIFKEVTGLTTSVVASGDPDFGFGKNYLHM